MNASTQLGQSVTVSHLSRLMPILNLIEMFNSLDFVHFPMEWLIDFFSLACHTQSADQILCAAKKAMTIVKASFLSPQLRPFVRYEKWT